MDDKYNIFKYYSNFSKDNCNTFFLKKDGKINYNPNIYYQYLCMEKCIHKISRMQFPLLQSFSEDMVISKLLVLHRIQQNNYNYIFTNNSITLIDNNYIDTYLNLLFLEKIKEEFNDYISEGFDKWLSYNFYQCKLFYNLLNDNEILILIFYNYYIKHESFKDELYESFNKTIKDFRNYNELYLFLKKHKYVDTYYKLYGKYAIKNYTYVEDKVLNHPKINNFKKIYIKKIKKFSSFNLLKIINKKNIDNKFNIKYIKNKFIELTQKI
jgi:hypothetical protein